MAGITLAEAQDDLYAARANVNRIRLALSTQVSTSTGGRRIERSSLKDAIEDLENCERRVQRLSRGNRLSIATVVPL